MIDHRTNTVFDTDQIDFFAAGAGSDRVVASFVPERDEFEAWLASDPRRALRQHLEKPAYEAASEAGHASRPASGEDLERFDQDVILYWSVFVRRRDAISIAWKMGDATAIAEVLEEDWQWDCEPVSAEEAEQKLSAILGADNIARLLLEHAA